MYCTQYFIWILTSIDSCVHFGAGSCPPTSASLGHHTKGIVLVVHQGAYVILLLWGHNDWTVEYDGHIVSPVRHHVTRDDTIGFQWRRPHDLHSVRGHLWEPESHRGPWNYNIQNNALTADYQIHVSYELLKDLKWWLYLYIWNLGFFIIYTYTEFYHNKICCCSKTIMIKD